MDAGPETGEDGEVVIPQAEGSTVDGEADERTAQRESPGPEPTAVTRKPAVTRREERPADDESRQGVVTPAEPPEPEAIDTENAAFVLLGVVLVVGFVLVAVAGL
jgi:hypothetical protein